MAKEPTTLDEMFNQYEAEKAAEPLPPVVPITPERQAQIDAFWDVVVNDEEDEDEEDEEGDLS